MTSLDKSFFHRHTCASINFKEDKRMDIDYCLKFAETRRRAQTRADARRDSIIDRKKEHSVK